MLSVQCMLKSSFAYTVIATCTSDNNSLFVCKHLLLLLSSPNVNVCRLYARNWMNMEDIPYDVGTPDAVQKVDDELKNDLAELKSELEENDLLHGAARNAR